MASVQWSGALRITFNCGNVPEAANPVIHFPASKRKCIYVRRNNTRRQRGRERQEVGIAQMKKMGE